ncbi:hypothetical protein LRP49_24135 [Enterovibrio sp. ZSDZ35]|uniref:Anti-sigma factor n=1 Tax=Enterovibrio qingdaonensis TaxID=2899818 RepID=A0ABT5QTH0_9GAMM|nr:hypothetical protein [Enterovibrio sp. ZSDZ35]MDD1784270.1 hypothetical protein [Enterovibrio sp. ZSDZ35]
MTHQFSDDEIIALYKDGAIEEPSELIDARILRYAQSQTKQERKPKYPWWQITGIAATVGFVAILAPWEWADKPLSTPPAVIQESLEVEMMMDAVPADVALPEAPQTEMKARANAEVQSRKFASELKREDSEKIIAIKLKEIQTLLDNDDTEQAKEKLEQLLNAYPQAKEAMTEEMKALMGQ